MTSKDTIDLRQDAEYDILLDRGMDLNAVLTATYYTGTTDTAWVYFDFTSYTGATITVKQNYKSTSSILTFDTSDGSIVLGTTGGTFQLIKSAMQLSIVPIGTYQYSMYLRSATQSKRGFLSGNFIIEAQIL
jgi:hypothetical protein